MTVLFFLGITVFQLFLGADMLFIGHPEADFSQLNDKI